MDIVKANPKMVERAINLGIIMLFSYIHSVH